MCFWWLGRNASSQSGEARSGDPALYKMPFLLQCCISPFITLYIIFLERVKSSPIASKSNLMTRVRIIAPLPVSPGTTHGVEWGLRPDLESEITTLAALCQVKQQQREPIAPSPQESEDGRDDLTEDEECTSSFFPSLPLDAAEIKRGFLDRLAELLCYRKDPVLISSTALIYRDDEVTIVAARNSSLGEDAWSNKDVRMLEYLGEVLERISSDGRCSRKVALPRWWN